MDLRQYDPAIGRWVVQDPVIHHEFSPYNAFDNNPVYWADPSGADAIGVTIADLFNAADSGTTFLFDNGELIGQISSPTTVKAFLQSVYEATDIGTNSNGAGGGVTGGGNGGGTGNGGVPSMYSIFRSTLASLAMSDTWNSPLARFIVPDKISFGFSQSATAYYGYNKGLFFEFITRGRDASLVPYVTFSVGMQAGPKLNADALFVVGIGYFVTTDMRNLTRGEAAEGLLGWSLNFNGGAGDGFGGALGGSYGFQTGNMLEPTWISGSVGGGYYMGGGATGGFNHTSPVFESQFKF